MKQYYLTVKASVMKTLFLRVVRVMRAEAMIKFGQENILRILVVSILSLELQWTRTYEAPHVNKDFTPLTIFPLFFMEMIHGLVSF
jgi:hypothetical protein